MTTRQAKKDAFTHVMVNVLDFQSDNPMEVEMTECGYDRINNLATMDKDEVLTLKYPRSSIDTPVPMKPKKKLLHLLWWRDYTVSLKSDKLMSTDEWMKLTQDDYEAFQSKKAEILTDKGRVNLRRGIKKNRGTKHI